MAVGEKTGRRKKLINRHCLKERSSPNGRSKSDRGNVVRTNAERKGKNRRPLDGRKIFELIRTPKTSVFR